jgi:CheY-like chemotaxis protein
MGGPLTQPIGGPTGRGSSHTMKLFLHCGSWSPLLSPDVFPPKGPRELDTRTSRLSSVPTGKLKVIVADDEPMVAFTLTEILKDEGFEVVSVADGVAAIEKARTMRPDILLSDVMMPKMNGIDAAKSIKDFLPDCRIILFSGQAATGELLKQAHAEGHVFEIVTKPIQPDALLAIVRGPGGSSGD